MQRRSLHRTLPGRLSLAALLPLLAGLGCGGSTSEPTPTPTPPPVVRPARVVVVQSPATTGGPQTAAGEYVVRVEDAGGQGVTGVRVQFSGQSGRPFTFVPRDTTTDSTGVARTAVTYGVADPAMVNVTVTPGPPAAVWINPGGVRLYGAGDSASFQAFVTDGFLNPIPNVPFGFQISDSTLLSVTAPTTLGGNGTIRSLKGGGSATITATVAARSSTVTVSVFARSRTACTGITAPFDLSAGVLGTVTDSVFCIAPNARGAEYALIVYNGSTDGTASQGTTVTAYNVEADLLSTRVPSGTPLLSRSPRLVRRANPPTLNLRFHERLRTESRWMRRLFAPARAARSLARSGGGATGRIAGRRLSYALNVSATSAPAVDDLLPLNVATASCTNADLRTFRVEAVGTKAIVLADTANPTRGFSRTDYQRIAARFDTLVLPLDRDAFGDPSDIDGNGHVAILFTRAVNELTPANSGSFVGGFFHPRDLFPRVATSTADACETSNEGEMFYMIVPDPTGVVNGNEFSLGMVDTLTTGILAHELQHLINASRRMYVNTAAQDFEETWLDEGLSHEAEELLYFRESGFAPRSRLTSQAILDSWPHFNAWVSDDASNFVRFYLYLRDPANHSPIDAGDELETRGATWAFLRFAVDQSFSSDAGVWQRFGNSTTTGLGTMTFGLQRDPKPLLRDFALANFPGVLYEPRYLHPSWDFASVYNQVFTTAYPLPFGQLKEATAIPVAARGGSASYYKFVAPPDVQTLLTFGSAQARPSSDLTFMLVRTGLKP